MEKYFFEYTDTYGGEANYTWADRFLVSAKTLRGALIKVSKELGLQKALKLQYNTGDSARWDIKNSCTCLFYRDCYENDIKKYYNLKVID